MSLISGNKSSWLVEIWDALEDFRDTCIPEGDPLNDARWDDICTAMAWIAEELGIPDSEWM